MKIKELRQAGYKVRVNHFRYHGVTGCLHPAHFFRESAHPMSRCWISPKGGLTEVEIRTPDGKELKGKAECSRKDTFNRKLGLTIAVNRALKTA